MRKCTQTQKNIKEKVDFYAKVFVQPERDKDGTYIQGWAGPNNSMNTIIGIKDTKIDVQVEDIIHIKGEVKDTFEGKMDLEQH